ncbi:uncharacterized protein LOC131589877 isoform X3 [Poecile atricapillus]|uniref:uncharacterized protein LOC131589877 isoform X3 n=1 Tax=Poecile atricapillus TaxID=48891 RepID=UPI00273865DB|nr:uncharacterized protein LOC131589877 isoform X3 [Poecile atricapillus]
MDGKGLKGLVFNQILVPKSMESSQNSKFQKNSRFSQKNLDFPHQKFKFSPKNLNFLSQNGWKRAQRFGFSPNFGSQIHGKLPKFQVPKKFQVFPKKIPIFPTKNSDFHPKMGIFPPKWTEKGTKVWIWFPKSTGRSQNSKNSQFPPKNSKFSPKKSQFSPPKIQIFAQKSEFFPKKLDGKGLKVLVFPQILVPKSMESSQNSRNSQKIPGFPKKIPTFPPKFKFLPKNGDFSPKNGWKRAQNFGFPPNPGSQIHGKIPKFPKFPISPQKFQVFPQKNSNFPPKFPFFFPLKGAGKGIGDFSGEEPKFGGFWDKFLEFLVEFPEFLG